MKILILLLGLTAAFGAAGKKTAIDLKEMQQRNEIKALQKYPNLLPEVVVTISKDSIGI
jgi:hypothetical protein